MRIHDCVARLEAAKDLASIGYEVAPAAVLWACSNRIPAPDKVIADTCVDESRIHVKLGVGTIVDLDDIRLKRPTLKPFQGLL